MSTQALVNLIAALALAAGTGAALAQDKAPATDATAKPAAAAKKATDKATADKAQPAARQVVPTAAGATTAPGSAEKSGGKHCHDKSADA